MGALNFKDHAFVLSFLGGSISFGLIKEAKTYLVNKLMIRSLVPEEPTGETDCSTVILSQR